MHAEVGELSSGVAPPVRAAGAGVRVSSASPGGAAGDPRQRVFIGDVQGCDDELAALLDALAFDPDRHALWFVGDLVNRGPASLAALRRICAMAAGAVLGNHDLHLLGVADGSREPRKGDTLDEVLEAPDAPELLGWLRGRPLIATWDDLILVHAGLHPAWSDPEPIARRLEQRIRAREIPWDDPDLSFLTRVRYCDAEGGRPNDSDRPVPDRYAPWDTHYRGARRVVFGHWAERGRVCTERVRGLDTGCVWGGRLTAWIAEEDRFVEVPARRAYREPKGEPRR